jgi:hypothetical protein
MGERKFQTSSESSIIRAAPSRNMAASAPGVMNFTKVLRGASTGTRLVRCPSSTLSRLRQLNVAEIITLFTPFVPHPPSTTLAKNMDPFEPLGRSLPRQVRHVPYRLDNGMTETHTDFLPTSGAIVIVVCSTEDIISHNSKAFEQQTRFARNVAKKVEEGNSPEDAPVVLLLITNGAASQVHEDELRDFPTLITCDNYTPSALQDFVQLIFGV